jgi:O-antigen ligase
MPRELPAPESHIPGDPLAWILMGFAAAGTVLAVSMLTGETLIRHLYAAGVMLAAISILALVIRLWAVPTEAQDPMRLRPGTLPAQGIFWNINILGMIMGGALVLQATYLRDSWRRLGARNRWILLLVGPVASLVLVWASSSRTALAASVLALAVALVLPWQHWRGFWPAVLFVAGCAAVVAAPLFVALGLGYELNGRRNLWTLVLDEIAVNPLLGRGFGNINGEQHAHNQLLETWLHAGAFGVLVLIGIGLVAAVAAVRAAPWDGKIGIAIVSYTALLWGTEIISPWAVFRSLPLPLLFSLLGLLAAVALAQDRKRQESEELPSVR